MGFISHHMITFYSILTKCAVNRSFFAGKPKKDYGVVYWPIETIVSGYCCGIWSLWQLHRTRDPRIWYEYYSVIRLGGVMALKCISNESNDRNLRMIGGRMVNEMLFTRNFLGLVSWWGCSPLTKTSDRPWGGIEMVGVFQVGILLRNLTRAGELKIFLC